MLNAINKTINDAIQSMNNSMARMYFQFANIYVKATPEQLLDINYTVGSTNFKIEDMAQVIVADEYTFHVFPNSKGFTSLLGAALKQEKPLFKQKLFDNPYGEVPEDAPKEVKDRWPDQIYAVAMPDVTSDQRDLYTKGVDYLHEQTKLEIEATYAKAKASLDSHLTDFPKDFADQTREKLDKGYNDVMPKVQEYYDKKISDIEEAYDYYERYGEREIRTAPADPNNMRADAGKPNEVYKKGAMPKEDGVENDGSSFMF